MYEGVSDDLPIEALVARNMGDPDWEDLCDDPRPMLAEGCTRRASYERERPDRFEAEPETVKAFVTRKRHKGD